MQSCRKIKKSAVEVCDDGGTNTGSWSLLPPLLLWMIKDKLHFVSNVRISAVCRDWRSASESYPKRFQPAKDGVPWIQHASGYSHHFALKFISVSLREKFVIRMPESRAYHSTLYSKQGWLLFIQTVFSSARGILRLHGSVFLFNPFSRTKLDLPDLEDTARQYVGSFSITDEGYPNRVVLAARGNGGVLLRVAHPGSKEWIVHSGVAPTSHFNGFFRSAVIGDHFYCFDLAGRMLIYNVETRVWNTLPRSGLPWSHFMVESEGEIIKIYRDKDLVSLFRFYRYSHTNIAWEELSTDDVKDKSWFLSNSLTSFALKDEGSRVYVLDLKFDRNRRSSRTAMLLFTIW